MSEEKNIIDYKHLSKINYEEENKSDPEGMIQLVDSIGGKKLLKINSKFGNLDNVKWLLNNNLSEHTKKRSKAKTKRASF